MNDIERKIEALREEIAELERTAVQGYYVEEVLGYEEYTIRDDHEAIYALDGTLAGIVVNQKVMTKYFQENPYAA